MNEHSIELPGLELKPGDVLYFYACGDEVKTRVNDEPMRYYRRKASSSKVFVEVVEGSVMDVVDKNEPFDQTEFAIQLNSYAQSVHRCAVDHGWWGGGPDLPMGLIDRNMGEMIALMHSELSEALEEYRDNKPYLYYVCDPPLNSGYTGIQTWEGPPNLSGTDLLGKPEGLAAEFADVIIRILDTCAKMDIPITEALLRKHEYNLTRPYRHGGKLA